MEWKKIKSIIYEEDGSLRDIVMYNISETHWQKYIEFINKNFKIEWEYMHEDLKTVETRNYIDFNEINYIWNNPDCNRWSPAEIYLKNIPIKVHFFDKDIFECSFWPYYIQAFDDHNLIIEHLKLISKLLDNDVYLYPEFSFHNINDGYYLKVNNDNIEYKI